jgi:ABC-type lipoprotein release transport system permease subunit
MISKLYLIGKELTGAKFITFIVFSVILLSVSAILFFNILSDNFNRHIKNNFASSIPPNEIKVKPGEGKSIFLFSTGTGKELDSAAISAISKIQGVKKVDSVTAVTVPTYAEASFLTFRYGSDLICAGADYKLVESDIKSAHMRDAWIKGASDGEIPVLIPKSLIDSYNNGLAAANGLPEIAPDRLSGLKINRIAGLKAKISFGRSSISALTGSYDAAPVIAGYTDKVNITGLVIPMKSAAEINKKFNKAGRIMFALVGVKDHKDFEYVKNRIKSMGFITETGESISSEILKLKETVNAFIAAMISLVSILAATAIALCSVTALWGRIDYYRIMRTLGASKFFIALTIIIKFSLTGFLAAWLGICLVEIFKAYILKSIAIPGIKLTFDIPQSTKGAIITAAAVIPILASIPTIIRMFSAKLDKG